MVSLNSKIQSSLPYSTYKSKPSYLLQFLALLLITFLSYSASTAAVTIEEGTWEPVSSATITQGDKVYDRRSPYGRAYYTDNQISAGSAVESDMLRLVVLSNSHPIINSDGTTDAGLHYFNYDGTDQTIRIYFSLTRAAFSYEIALQQLIMNEVDTDGDGIPDSDDVCPADPANDADADGICGDIDICPADPENDADADGICGDIDVCPTDPLNDNDADGICDSDDICLDDPLNICFTVTGFISGNGSALDNANVKIGANSVFTQSNGAGEFTANVGPNEMANDRTGTFFPVQVTMPDFSTGNAKVRYVAGQDSYSVTVNLQQVSDRIDENDDITQGVALVKDGAPVGSLKIPTDSLPAGTTSVTGEITYLDPETDDMLSMPGDLLALPVGADPNDDPVALETFGMMEFDLKDQNGNPVTQLPGDAEVCMRAPTGLALGDTIPLWYYDEDQGLWIEEGQGTVVDRDGQLQICGAVSHFSWWNYDQPIVTHSCFSYQMIDEATNLPIAGLDWYAEGSTYNGSSPSRACTGGSGSFASFTVKISDPNDLNNPERIRVFTYVAGTKFYLVSDNDGTYRLTPSGGTLFETPTVNGSCLSGTLSGSCTLLDFDDINPDGILPVDMDNINLPPVITEFVIGDYLMLPGESMALSATVTDPENDNVTLNWTSLCGFANASSVGSYSDPLQDGLSGTNFVNTFNSPDSLNYPVAYCELKLTAIDEDGAASQATRWITVASSFGYQVQGVLFGTDGSPLANTEINYNNWDCDNLSQTVFTGPNGEYQFDIDFADCIGLSEGGGFYYDLGYVYVQFEKSGNQWLISHYINNEINGGNGPDLGCNALPDGATSCDVDIHLPVLWGPIGGSIQPQPFIDGFSLEYYSYIPYDLWMIPIDIQPGATDYGPIQMPVGQGYLSLYSSDFSIWRNHDVQLLNQAGLTVDIGDGQVPVSVTLFDNSGVPIPGIEISGTSGNGINQSHSEVTDSNGNVMFNSSLGRLDLSSNNPFYYFEGSIHSVFEPIVIDLNSTTLCSILVTVYDEFGVPLPNEEFGWNGEFSSGSFITDNVGQFRLDVSAGNVQIYSLFDSLVGLYFYIDNCRPVNGSPRDIILDIPTSQFGFGFGGGIDF